MNSTKKAKIQNECFYNPYFERFLKEQNSKKDKKKSSIFISENGKDVSFFGAGVIIAVLMIVFIFIDENYHIPTPLSVAVGIFFLSIIGFLFFIEFRKND
jgi:hypothetical protein